jgi:hypothetical protein
MLFATVSCQPTAGDEVIPVATVRDIMADMIAPSADILWSAIMTVSTPDGYEDRAPETDEEWARLRHGAVTMVESANLLLTEGRRVAAEGSASTAPGVQLEPDSIAALLTADREAWIRFTHELQESGQVFLEAIDAKDASPLLDAGDGLNTACENCHQVFWYPPSP